MEEKTTPILQAEVVKETPKAEETAVPPAATGEAWNKFPPQIDDVGQSQDHKGSKGLLILVVILVLVAVGIVGFVVYKSNAMNKQQIAAVPTPIPDATASEASPSATPTPQIADKSVVKIQILNGSGVVGQAAQVATALEKADFKTPDTGNFEGPKQAETIVNYTSGVDKTMVDEVVAVLEKLFTSVNASVSSTLTDFDIQIITGTDE